MSEVNKSITDALPDEKENKRLPKCKLNQRDCEFYKKGRRCASEFVKITIDEEKGKPNYETVSVNGFSWQIKRGEVVPLPICAIGVLECAIATRYVEVPNPATGHDDLVPKRYSAIPWRVVR